MFDAKQLANLWHEFRETCDDTGCSDGLVVADGTLLKRLDEILLADSSSHRVVVHLQDGVFREIAGLPAGIQFEIRDSGTKCQRATGASETPEGQLSSDQSPACDRWRCDRCLFEAEIYPKDYCILGTPYCSDCDQEMTLLD